MRYCPVASETAVRVFSISAGLAASTVTPGNTAPDASLTVPARATWAYTADGSNATNAAAAMILTIERMSTSPKSFLSTQSVNRLYSPTLYRESHGIDRVEIPERYVQRREFDFLDRAYFFSVCCWPM